jgi:DNA-directed RNA polymerase specialized sigma24 family protein
MSSDNNPSRASTRIRSRMSNFRRLVAGTTRRNSLKRILQADGVSPDIVDDLLQKVWMELLEDVRSGKLSEKDLEELIKPRKERADPTPGRRFLGSSPTGFVVQYAKWRHVDQKRAIEKKNRLRGGKEESLGAVDESVGGGSFPDCDDPAVLHLEQESRRVIDQEIEKLPPRLKKILGVWREYPDILEAYMNGSRAAAGPGNKVAELTGLSPENVRSAVVRLRVLLGKALRKYWGTMMQRRGEVGAGPNGKES